MIWDCLETPLRPTVQFFIEAPDREPASELQRVASFRRDLRKGFPAARVAAFPNAGKRGPAAVRQAKAEGMAPGMVDMLVLHAGRLAFLEWKNGRDLPSNAQTEWMNWLDAQGHVVGCVRTSRGAIAFLKERGVLP
jgi:hypothetical protein